MGIITFGHVAQTFWGELTHEEQDRALRTITDRIAARLKTTISGLVLHRDEEADHAHFQMPGFDLDGQPLSQTARRQALRDLQTIAAEVMRSFDPRFERGFSKEQRKEAGATPAEVENKTVAQLHQTRALDLEKQVQKLADLNEKIRKNARLIEKTDAKIIAGKGDLAKLTANIEAYTRRLNAARLEADQEEARLTAIRARSQKSQDEKAAKTRVAESATLAAQIREKTAFIASVQEEARRDRLTRAADEAAADLDAINRAQDVIDRAADLAASNPTALLASALPSDPEARDIPPPDPLPCPRGKADEI